MAKLKCMYCLKQYATKGEVDVCERGHRDKEEIIYVPILKEDLNILAHFLMTGNPALLTERASSIIMRYFRSSKSAEK